MDKYGKKLERIDQVVAWRLCMGCGACKWACPHGAIDLVNITTIGIRPAVNDLLCQECGKCIEVCPGIHLHHDLPKPEHQEALFSDWGPIHRMYRAYAAENGVRFTASSGGIATALALYGIEQAGMVGVLQIQSDSENPLMCIPTLSQTREEILSATGSRYAPAAPCQAFDLIKQAAGPVIFIGKPCDVAALRKAQKIDPELDVKVGLAVSIFCAGTPSSNGTQAILSGMGVKDATQVTSFRYRGHGWPGAATAILSDGNQETMSYEVSWGNILSKHVSLRCRLCPDGTGEFADISCGDMWAQRDQDTQGLSNVLIRTHLGLEFWHHNGMQDYITWETCDNNLLPLSQPSLLNKKKQLWGRLRTMALLGIPVPHYKGFFLKGLFQSQSRSAQIKVKIGTFRRIFTRKWMSPLKR